MLKQTIFWVVGVFLSTSFAQQLDGNADRFVQQMFGNLSYVIETCARTEGGSAYNTICAQVEPDFADFRKNWDSWAAILLRRFDGEIFRAWLKNKDVYSIHYTFRDNQNLVSIYFDKGYLVILQKK